MLRVSTAAGANPNANTLRENNPSNCVPMRPLDVLRYPSRGAPSWSSPWPTSPARCFLSDSVFRSRYPPAIGGARNVVHNRNSTRCLRSPFERVRAERGVHRIGWMLERLAADPCPGVPLGGRYCKCIASLAGVDLVGVDVVNAADIRATGGQRLPITTKVSTRTELSLRAREAVGCRSYAQRH